MRSGNEDEERHCVGGGKVVCSVVAPLFKSRRLLLSFSLSFSLSSMYICRKEKRRSIHGGETRGNGSQGTR